MLFINALNEVAREQAQSFLRDSHQQKILAAYEAFTDQDGFAAVATLDQIGRNGYNLAIPRYVAGSNGNGASSDETLDVEEAIELWREAAVQATAALGDVLALLRQDATR